MVNVGSNMNSLQSELWERARSRWISNIHNEIGKIGRDRDNISTRVEEWAPQDAVFLSDNAKSVLSGNPAIWKQNVSLRHRMTARDFRGQIAAQDMRNNDGIPVPIEQNFPPLNAYLSGQFRKTPIEPNFVDYTEGFQFSLPEGKSSAQASPEPEPYCGGFSNPFIDTLADIGGTIFELISYGFGDLKKMLLGAR